MIIFVPILLFIICSADVPACEDEDDDAPERILKLNPMDDFQEKVRSVFANMLKEPTFVAPLREKFQNWFNAEFESKKAMWEEMQVTNLKFSTH